MKKEYDAEESDKEEMDAEDYEAYLEYQAEQYAANKEYEDFEDYEDAEDYVDLQVIRKYCLIDLKVRLVDEMDQWNYLAQQHREALYSIEGQKIIRRKIFRGDFGKCPICETPLMPFGRRNKPYMASLWLMCPCTGEFVSEIPELDGAVYGRWVDFEKPIPAWINELKKNCEKHKEEKKKKRKEEKLSEAVSKRERYR